MAKKNKNISPDKLVVEYLQQNIGRYRRELDSWKNAREMRYDVDYPLTYAIQEVYSDCMVDTRLRAVSENRILRIVNMPFEIVDAEGMVDKDLTKLITKPWFTDIIRYLMESVFYGYNLVKIDEVKDGEIKKVSIIPREHIIPEKEWVINNTTDTTNGFPYNDFPNHLLYCQMYDAYGLLEQAAPLTILKRHSWGSWDEFEQKFSLPIMVAKVASGNKGKRQEVAKWMQQMGRSSSGVFDQGTEIEIKDGNKSDAYQVFLQKISTVNSELNVLINGQTMSVENGSSRSQSETHLKTQDEITRADKREVLNWLNDILKPALIYWGYPLKEDSEFSIQNTINANDKIKIDSILMQQGYKMTPEYIERIYGVELDTTIVKEDTIDKKKS